MLACYLVRLAESLACYLVTLKKLEDITAYRISTELSDEIWEIVSRWEWFSKKTVGDQYVRAVDSISANIAEGFGRFHKKDKNKFFFNARASVFEAAHWTKQAWARKLLNDKQYENIMQKLRMLPREINYLIKITRENLKY